MIISLYIRNTKVSFFSTFLLRWRFIRTGPYMSGGLSMRKWIWGPFTVEKATDEDRTT